MSALIGALRVSLSADTAKFEQGMKRAQRQTQTSSSAISKSMGMMKAGIAGFVSGLSIGLLTNAIKGALEYAGSLGEVSQQLGTTTKDLQVFRFAAGQVGISSEEVDKGLLKLRVTLGQVAAGAAAPTKALAAIGITAKDLAGLDTGAAFRRISDGLAGVTDGAQRAAVEVALFGRTGAKLDNLLAGGSKALNELSAAAEKLGIVLSDDQIQNADATADKLAALQTVLKAQIAGVVADNADAILGLANALVSLVSTIGVALNAWRQFQAEFNSSVFEAMGNEAAAAKWRGSNFQSGKQATIPGRSVSIKLAPPKEFVPPAGPDIGKFLAGGGGSKKAPKGPKDTSLRDAFQFDQELLRAQMDVLRATQDLSFDYVQRGIIALHLLDLEKQSYDAELDYSVAAGERTKPQADMLRLEYDRRDQLERDKVLHDEQRQRTEEFNESSRMMLEVARDKLESELQLADTAAEQRDLQLKILEYNYRIERARLETVLADEASSESAKNEARQRLAAMPGMLANDQRGVRNATRGPWEEYAASIPDDAGKMQEALEQVRVDGVEALTNSLVDAMTGVKSLGAAFKEVAAQIVADLLKIYIRKMLVGALSNALGGAGGLAGGGGGGTPQFSPSNPGVGFAKGGSIAVMGRGGTDRNILSMNGLPIARVSKGERIDVSNGGGGGGGMRVEVIPSPYFNVVVDGRATAIAMPLAGRAAVMGAAGAEQRSVNAARRRIP